jgi:2-polyprenyl-3-methyl-5-hydroxy-6-metoxy-1,4-benzoquinol methylase
MQTGTKEYTQNTDSDSVWTSSKPHILEFHMRQYKNPYYSTSFVICNLHESGALTGVKSMLDVGCGAGAVGYEFARAFPDVKYVGSDISSDIIEIAKLKHQELKIPNTSFIVETDIKKINADFDLIGSMQLLNIIDFQKGLTHMEACFQKSHTGVFMMSFFTDTLLEFSVTVVDNYNDENVPYNIHSIPRVELLAKMYGFALARNIWFEFPVDLAKPRKPGRGAYTRKLESGKCLQFTDVLHLPWRLLYFKKV